MKIILYIATLIIVVTYLFWEQIENYLGFHIFEINTAIFITLLCVYLFFNDKKSLIKFVLLSLSLNNLFDELFFSPRLLEVNELITGLGIIIFAIIKSKNA